VKTFSDCFKKYRLDLLFIGANLADCVNGFGKRQPHELKTFFRT